MLKAHSYAFFSPGFFNPENSIYLKWNSLYEIELENIINKYIQVYISFKKKNPKVLNG